MSQLDNTRRWREAYPERARELHRKGHLKRKYGLSLEEYNELFRLQDGCCAICKIPETEINHTYKVLAVDHCHETGRVRGLICIPCNTGLGLLSDDRGLLERAILYLEQFEL